MAGLSARLRGGLVLSLILMGFGTTHLFASETGEVPAPSAAPVEEAADRVVVRVNGDPIMASEVARELRLRVPNVSGHGSLSPARMQEHWKRLVTELAVNRLILQAALAADLTVSDEEIARERTVIEARFPNRAAYQAAMAQQGLDPESIDKGLREHLLGRKMEEQVTAGVKPPGKKDLRAYFADHPDKFRIPPQAEVSYLMVKVDASAPEETWQQAKARVAELSGQVKGGEPFAAASADAGKADDVDVVNLGRVHQGQADLKEIDQVAFTLQAGQISDPVWTLFGYAVVYVHSRVEARDMAFEELNLELFGSELLDTRRKEARQAWISSLMAKAKLEFSE